MSLNTTIDNLKSIIVAKHKEFEDANLEYVDYRDIHIDMLIDSMEINLITLRDALQLIEDETTTLAISDVNMNTLISMHNKKKSEAKLLDFAIKLIEKKQNRSDSIIRDLELIIVDHVINANNVDMLIGSIDSELISLRQSLELIKAEVNKSTNTFNTDKTVEINFITLINIYHNKTKEMRSLNFAIKCINKITNEIVQEELVQELDKILIVKKVT
jgi:hypothetical protein